MTFSGITRAEDNKYDKTITFVNTSGRFLWVAFWGTSKCMNPPPEEGSFSVPIDGFTHFPLNPDSSCGDASIQFTVSVITSNSVHPYVGGDVTYRKYKSNNRWLQKIEWRPTKIGTFFPNFVRALCGASYNGCKGIGIPFENAQATIALMDLGLVADRIFVFPGKSR
jgi:hypothetical protein